MADTETPDVAHQYTPDEIDFNVDEFFHSDAQERRIRQRWKARDADDRAEFIHEVNQSVHLSLRIAEVLSAVVETTRPTETRSEDNAVTHIAASKALRRVLPRIIKNLQLLSAAMAAQHASEPDQQPAPVDERPGMYL